MLGHLGLRDLDDLIRAAVPSSIRSARPLELGEAWSEHDLMQEMRRIAAQNSSCRSYLGTGFSDCITPAVLQRNILENPAWYTQYTPYQAEISQGRLEALLNYQTTVIDLTGLPVANASLLDESTAAAEAVAVLHELQKRGETRDTLFVAADCHPQTVAVVETRAQARGWGVVVGDPCELVFDGSVFGALVQYPGSDGTIRDYGEFCERAHASGARVAMACDLLALTLLTPPGDIGADVAVGSTQRFGMPMGLGGPHAAYFATRDEYRRQVPGRIIGVSVDADGKPAYRMALQTREQHIRRERATSNICTAQVLPAIVAGMYAVYHGPDGLRRIAERVRELTRLLAAAALRSGLELVSDRFFDTVGVRGGRAAIDDILSRARQHDINLRRLSPEIVGISLDEATSTRDLQQLMQVISPSSPMDLADPELESEARDRFGWDDSLERRDPFLSHPVFNRYHSETEMLRYIRRLESRDLSLTTSMIPLGSCTMKLNATVEMMPVTWPEFARLHPFAPVEQSAGYTRIFAELSEGLAEITGLPAVSLMPNAGSQGEYAGLLVIRRYHAQRGEGQRDICLIPASAHGTNPASAVMAGLEVEVVACDEAGNVDIDDLRTRAGACADRLAALMVTYPSTHGVFEEHIHEICDIIHDNGGQVYLDGANMNALVGICRPGEIGADVCHLNLHKTFCIPHGGGGPGMGPIAAAHHLAEYLPTHPVVQTGGCSGIGPIAAAPWGSAVVLIISWAYLKLMGSDGLRRATEVAILNANYVAHRLAEAFPVLYRGNTGFVAHEAILDLRDLKARVGVEVEDVAKRLMDYGYHAPTVHFPVPGTVMVEPTESESRSELDRFCEAMIAIRREIAEVEGGSADPEDNVLKNAPHSMAAVLDSHWSHPYTREQAATPAPWLREHKFWPAVARIDNAAGDRNLVCACPPVLAYSATDAGEAVD